MKVHLRFMSSESLTALQREKEQKTQPETQTEEEGGGCIGGGERWAGTVLPWRLPGKVGRWTGTARAAQGAARTLARAGTALPCPGRRGCGEALSFGCLQPTTLLPPPPKAQHPLLYMPNSL